MKAFRAKISGVVQGVGFRYWVLREAFKHRIHGWVRNAPDGSVEVYAEGADSDIEQFEKLLPKGSPASHVKQVLIDYTTYKGTYEEFTIEY